MVFVLDMDGVLLRTNLIKHGAMLSLFESHGARTAEISAYILAHGGVPRREKIEAILRTILYVPPERALVDGYLRRYGEKLADLLARAPLIEGVYCWISGRGDAIFSLSSSAPEEEVHAHLRRTGLHSRFSRIYAGDTPKHRALEAISRIYPDSPILFFGDSRGDWEAARKASVAFVAVVSERDDFEGVEVVKLRDFSSASEVEACVREALRCGHRRLGESDPGWRPPP